MHAGIENQYMDQYQNIVTLYILNQECVMLITSIGMYSGCDTLSLQTLFVYFLALPSLLHPSILFNCFLYLLLLH